MSANFSANPRSSGILTGGGSRRFKRRRHVIQNGFLTHMPDVHMSDAAAIKREVWDFDPEWEFKYSQRELLLMAEKILLEDPKPRDEHPVWLSVSQLIDRSRREIYVGDGVPDPSIASGYYWRTHPQGRKVNSDEQRRRNGAGFYR